MKQHRNTGFWKNIVWMFVFCLRISFVEAQGVPMINVPVDTFVENNISVGIIGRECLLHFKVSGPQSANMQNILAYVNSQLTYQKITWIYVKKVMPGEYYADGDYSLGTIVFQLADNNTERERWIWLRTVNNITFAQILQNCELEPTPFEVYNVSSDCDIDCAFPGRKIQITLSGSEVGALYILDVDTLQGTGAPLTFKKNISQEGVYRVKAMKGNEAKLMSGTVDIYYFPFLKAGLCTNEQRRISPIFLMKYGCGFVIVQIPFINSMSTAQLA